MNEFGPYAFVYGAFAERRVFLRGWGYSDKASLRTSSDLEAVEEYPYPERLALNEAAFQRPTAVVLGDLHDRYGVGYLVVDPVNGFAVDRGRSVPSRPSCTTTRVTVFELVDPA